MSLPVPSAVTTWVRLLASGRVTRRAFRYAVVVGIILIVINHGDAILAGRVTHGDILKMGLTVLVPYLVSALSSVGATLEHARTAGPDGDLAGTEQARPDGSALRAAPRDRDPEC